MRETENLIRRYLPLIDEPEPRQVKIDVFWIVGGNFLGTLPQPARTREALEAVGTRIHHDIVLSPPMLVEPRDLVLLFPATTRYESPGGGPETSA